MPFKEIKQLKWVQDLYRLGQADLLKSASNEIFSRILQHIVSGMNAETGCLALYEIDNQHLTIEAAVGLPPDCIGKHIEVGSGIIGWVVQHQQALLLTGNISDDPRFKGVVLKDPSRQPASALCWPLQMEERIVGVLTLNIIDPARPGFTEDDLDSGLVIANLITLVLDNARLHNQQQTRLQNIASVNEELRQTRQRLEHSEKRLHDTLDSLDSVVWSISPDQFAPFYLNRAVQEVFGYPAEHFYQDANLWLQMIVDSDRPKVLACLRSLEQGGAQKMTYRINHPDQSQYWLFSHMRYIPESDGIPAHIDGITVNVTHYKHAEDLLIKRNAEIQTTLDKLQVLQQQLVQSEKMASVGQLAAGVAHEINNPIGYINSNLSSLKNYIDDLLGLIARYEQAEHSDYASPQLADIQSFKQQIDLDFLKSDVLDLLDESLEGTTRVKKIVQDLKDFSHQGESDDWQWVNLHTGLESTLNIVHNEIKYKAVVHKNLGVLPELRCLPHQLSQVFMNLLVNAGHAIEADGSITISSGLDKDMVWVEISDNGKGIAPEHLSKIFDPFFTTKPVGKGTGLGLSVSYNIVKKHQGEIEVHSEVGKGTCFRILLPIQGPK